jgi:superfamily I DNA and/or RNA helicase
MDLINDSPLDILKYWIDIELSSPPLIKINNSTTKNDSRWNQIIFSRDGDEDIIWQKNLRKKLSHPEDWIHRVYLGIFGTELVIEEFSNDSKDLNELKNTHKTCVISFILDQEGFPVKDSVIIPEYLTSISYAKSRKAKINMAFKDKIMDIYAQWSFMIYKNQINVSKVNLRELLNQILLELNWDMLSNYYQNGKADILAYTESLSLKHHRKLNFDSEISNSLIADDLVFISEELEHKELNCALMFYLNNKYESHQKDNLRIDVVNDTRYVSEKFNPELFPNAAWPLSDGQTLVLSQQFAVNKIFEELEHKNGIFSVNGPPGTGKTTLLKDVIANIIYLRSCALYEFRDNPTDAFKNLGTITYKFSGQGEKPIYGLHPVIQGYEIVVASSNNNAVKNITNELPLINEIDSKYKDKFKYLSEIATNINNSESWGMISATLGNKKNNYDFINQFLFNNFDDSGETTRSIFEFFKNPRYFNENIMSWKEACINFKMKKDRVEYYKNQLANYFDCLHNYKENINNHKDLQKLYTDNVDKHCTFKKTLEAKKIIFEKLSLDLEKLQRTKEKAGKKNLLNKITNTQLDEIELDEKIDSAKDSIVDLKHEIKDILLDMKEQEKLTKEIWVTYSEHKEILIKIKTIVKEHGDKINPSIPNDKFWETNEDIIQKLSPWMNKKFQEARNEMFIASLDLHKSFLIENSDKIHSNLRSLKEVLEGDFQEKDIYAQAILQTLFLVVPVVSTTFHSFGKVFQSMKDESIGWLLIDEAGQSTPQAPVGGLYRSKRAIFVGDPLQVEPVVQVEEKLSDVLMDKNHISKSWNSCQFSAQQIADRNNLFGTYLGMGENKIWVGSPLRVHRRCQNPMFRIANKIAYDNRMIYGKKLEHQVSVVEKNIGESCWFDLEGESVKESHFIRLEAEFLMKMLQKICTNNKLPNVYIISPFKSVAHETYKFLANNKSKWCPKSIPETELNIWLNKSIGTIHAFQGKEADSVFLILGGNISKPGAIIWVCEEPNILNVAATRAKDSFYVIGNSKIWNKGVFGLLRTLLNKKKINIKSN